MAGDKLGEAIAAFDAANAQDPNGKELLYAQRMSAWLERLAPDASDVVQLAVRAQHIRRWTVPRESYPMDRPGYRKWRVHLGRFHARTAGEILKQVGYGEQTVHRVQALLRKERLRVDPEVQLLEDVACLVFLEHYLAEFAAKQKRDKLVRIVRKTWNKMSPRGRDAALGLDFPDELGRIIREARASE